MVETYKKDITLSYEYQFKNLEKYILDNSLNYILRAPTKPALFQGTWQDFKDVMHLVTTIHFEISNYCAVAGIDDYPFQLKWGQGATRYGRNFESDKTMEENRLKLVEMTQDFVKFITNDNWDSKQVPNKWDRLDEIVNKEDLYG